jgi:hypothetical protein
MQPKKLNEVEEFEEVEDGVEEEQPKPKKKEVLTEQEEELTEEAVKQILTNLNYRVGRIEHHLRLDY